LASGRARCPTLCMDIPPGHIAVKYDPGAEILWFSPREELRTAEAVIDEEHAGDAGRLHAQSGEPRAEASSGKHREHACGETRVEALHPLRLMCSALATVFGLSG
jgi:hypothetical protein